MNQQSQSVNSDNSRSEVLSSIKDKLIEITSNRSYLPVYLNNVMIANPENYVDGSVKFYDLHSIFYGSDKKLYGDLLSVKKNRNDKEIIFGKLIENINIEDLFDLLNTLNSNKWKIIEDKKNTGEGNKNKEFFNIKKMLRRFNRQLGIRNA